MTLFLDLVTNLWTLFYLYVIFNRGFGYLVKNVKYTEQYTTTVLY